MKNEINNLKGMLGRCEINIENIKRNNRNKEEDNKRKEREIENVKEIKN